MCTDSYFDITFKLILFIQNTNYEKNYFIDLFVCAV